MMKARTKLMGYTVILLFLAFVVPQAVQSAEMKDYCVRPPFIEGVIPPNLLLMLDNSASMYDPAYTTSGAYCYDDGYDNTKDYVGYFSSIDNNGVISYPIYTFSGGKFVETASVPTNCTYGITGVLCVNVSGACGSRTVTQFTASGRFLNWLAASKFDLQKQILTGGKYDTSNQVLIGESRGCLGRRFVKDVRTLPKATCIDGNRSQDRYLTFAIRGPNSFDADFVNPSTQGGDARIELYEGGAQFNKDACLQAVNDWQSGERSGIVSDTKQCIGGDAKAPYVAAYNHIINDCFWYLYVDHKLANTNALQNECTQIYMNYTAQNPTADPRSITNDNAADAICSKVLSHPVYNGNDSGFMGKCVTISGAGTKTQDYTWDDANDPNGCSQKEQQDFCQGAKLPDVIDPSSAPNITNTVHTVPSFVMDSGLTSMTPVGSYFAKVAVSSAPKGVLNKFDGVIRFGAMAFNYDGSGAECGKADSSGNITVPCMKNCSGTTSKQCNYSTECPAGETCVDSKKTDGGKIISLIGAQNVCSVTKTTSCTSDAECPAGEVCVPTVGNHSTGLIKAIDALQGSSWTPFAEAYYNAIAYYVKDATATNSKLDSTKFTPTSSAISVPLKNPDNTYSDDYSNKNPILYRCQKNNVLLVTDGASMADSNDTMTKKVTDTSGKFRNPSTIAETGSTGGTCGLYWGSPYVHDLSYHAYHRNIFDPDKECPPPSGATYLCENAHNVRTYVVYSGSQTSTLTDVCNPMTQMQLTAQGGSFQSAVTPQQLNAALEKALLDIAGGIASGTAASVLASSSGSGANLLQAVFYPKRVSQDGVEASWIGELQNVWYYFDPFLKANALREDTPTKDWQLNLSTDLRVDFVFDPVDNKTKAVTTSGSVNFEDFQNSLWAAGRQLWSRTSSRTVYTTKDGSTRFDLINTDLNAAADQLRDFLQAEGVCSVSTANLCMTNADCPLGETCALTDTVRNARAAQIIRYTLGTDYSGYRERKVKVGGTTNVWKLGDVVSSTPKVAASTPINTYHLNPPGGYSDKSYEQFVSSLDYQDRTLAFVGANDGMVHAFNFGKLRQIKTASNPDVVAKLEGSNLGEEAWTYIPKNALPYLKYLMDPNYCHIYLVDMPVALVDASIGVTDSSKCTEDAYASCPKIATVSSSTGRLDLSKTSWRTVLIGGMGLGGACRKDCGTSTSCVQTPTTDPNDNTGTKGLGYSSYFALDVTETVYDPTKAPKLLWEFSHEDLGYALSGPAIVRIAADTATDSNTDKNGNWFVLIGSGPTGPIDKDHLQFLGKSDQRLKIFVLDLKTGALKATLSPNPPIDNAFASSLFNVTLDADRWNREASGFYQDDAVYVGYTNKTGSTSSWNSGGVLRVLTKTKDDKYENSDPSQWKVSTLLDGTGPVTSAVTKLQDTPNGSLWLYFGTGRYFFRYTNVVDSPGASDDLQYLYGVKDPCYEATGNVFTPSCTTAVSGSPIDRTSDITASAADPGWKITLSGPFTDTAGGQYYAERVITTPVAAFSGAVFFTTFAPSTEVCDFGGNTYIWALDYKSGGRAADLALQGNALVQVSTGEIRQIGFEEAFKTTDGTKTKRSPGIKGAPPFPAPPLIMIKPPPTDVTNRIIHIQEK